MVKRKFYQKPQIKQVNLVPEEAVLVGCKSSADPTGKVAGSNNLVKTKVDKTDTAPTASPPPKYAANNLIKIKC